MMKRGESDSSSFGRLLLDDISSYKQARKKKLVGAFVLFVVGIFGVYASLMGQEMAGPDHILFIAVSILFILMGVFLLLNRLRPLRIFENGIQTIDLGEQFIRFDKLEYVEKESDYTLTMVDKAGKRHSISATGSKRMDRAVWNKAVALILQRLKETHPDKKEYELVSDNRDI